MGCKTCYTNCDQLISDKCVEYTGPDVPLLGICTGDSLSLVEAKIVEKLQGIVDGTDIKLSDFDLDTCPYLVSILDKEDPTLVELIQVLWDNQCTLKQAIDDLIEEPAVFNTGCLTLEAGADSDDILQAVITMLCSIKTTVDAIPTTYVRTSDLQSQVTTIVKNMTTSTTTTVVQYNARMIPYVAYEYFPVNGLSGFDNTGKGIASAGFEKVYLCNGQNGTPDKRGRVGVGAVKNVPGGAMDPEVDPALSSNPQANYALKDKVGSNYHTMTLSELPSHSHTVTDPGHIHNYDQIPTDSGRCSGGDCVKPQAPGGLTKQTQLAYTGISIGSAGESQPIDIRQPAIAAYYIMYIP